MSFLDAVKKAAGRMGRTIVRDLKRNATRDIDDRINGTKKSRSQRTDRSTSPQRRSNDGPSRDQRGRTRGTAGVGVGLPGPRDQAIEYDVDVHGLPDFEYHPDKDGAPDPGEVVWTWVPYEENDGRGKDRPVLVLADTDEHVVFAQLTSKDHDGDRERHASYGVFWMDIGSGNWDSQGRPSEVRLDRLLVTHMDQVRREGGQLEKSMYDDVVAALKKLHRA